MKHHVLGLVLMVAAAGCGGAQKPQPPAASPCVAAAAHLRDVIVAAIGEAGGPSGPDAATMGPVVEHAAAERCQADGWSEQAITCVTTAADHAGMDACEPYITPAQSSALKAQIEHELGGDVAPIQDAEGGRGGSTEATEPPPPPADPCGGGE